jgi:uncharacterized RDD family membrane protein YckC
MNASTQTQLLRKRGKILVYFLAAPEEEDEYRAIRKHLTPAVRNSKIPIEIASDYDIPLGEDREKFKQKLLEADIVLALISVDFIDDDEINERNKKVIERHNNNETILVPILVRNCQWTKTPFIKLSLLPKNLQPLNNKQFWNSDDDALMAVVEDIYEAIDEFSNAEMLQPQDDVEFKSEPTKQVEQPSIVIEPEIGLDQTEKTSVVVELNIATEQQVEQSKSEINHETTVEKPLIPSAPVEDSKNTTQEFPKQSKAVIPIDVDWRKQYYKKVLWKRALAFFLDHLVMIPVSIFILLLSLFIGEFMKAMKEQPSADLTNGELIFYLLIGFLAYLFINAKMESSKWRGTLGKRILKLQITDKAGEPVSFFRALVRNILRPIVGYSYMFTLSIALIFQYFRFKKTKKLFHDELSSTVIGERLTS